MPGADRFDGNVARDRPSVRNDPPASPNFHPASPNSMPVPRCAGGTSGIALELAKELLKLQNTVIITGRDPGKFERAKKQLPQVHTVPSDASRVEEISSRSAPARPTRSSS
jgi:hypothetical protein